MRTALVIVVVLGAPGCSSTPDRLSRGDCERYAARFVDGPDAANIAIDPELRRLVIDDVVKDCAAGHVDRQELDCLLASRDPLDDLRCVKAGAARHPKRPSRGREPF